MRAKILSSRVSTWLAAIGLLIIAPPVAFLFTCQELETISTGAEALSQASLERFVERGFLPTIFTASERPFVLRYDIDTNRRCARFGYSKSGLAAVESRAVEAGFVLAQPAPPIPKAISLLKPCPVTAREIQGAKVLRRQSRPGSIYHEALAIESGSGHIYYWDYE